LPTCQSPVADPSRRARPLPATGRCTGGPRSRIGPTWTRRISPALRRNGLGWPGYARELWAVWSRMPHTALWGPTDWAYCIEALELAVRCAAEDSPVSAWVELRAREKAMGTTWDSRQGMRLKYVAPREDSGEAGSIASLDEYRNL
jgi:hypothetical protein